MPDYSDAQSSSSDFNINNRQERDNIVIIEEGEEEMKVQVIEYAGSQF